MPRIILIVVILIAAVMALRWFVNAKPADVARLLRRLGISVVIGILILLAATGRLNWLFALIASLLALLPRLLPLLRYVPLLGSLIAYLKRKKAASTPSPGQQSRVETRFLRITLDHDSGAMTGEILYGRFKGQLLSDLALDQLIALYKEYLTEDEQSAALLQAYLDRVHGEEWHHAKEEAASSVENAGMSHEEACEILGIGPEAGKEQIIEAHRRLMQKLHPDRGGSNYLAAKINQAKDILLDE
jgi:hypothetical protein